MPGSQLRKILQPFRRGTPNNEGWSAELPWDRSWEIAYRSRWQYDKIVRSTHGVNCTGSCSWRIYVKDGIITWEIQAIDYPSNGPNMPDYEPRGCPRGASFSWYVYSPLRIKYPYIRAVLWSLWKEALEKNGGDEVKAWESIVEDPSKAEQYKKSRGMGGFIRVSWEEAYRLISAALIYTIKKYGPDRIFGFSPIPAMSMVSYASGSRFLSLIGGVVLSFYDWYADLPPASPMIWGEQTDVPESADWYNSSYIIIWGTNLPMTRTPDAHFIAEVRYKGTKVVVISPDYSDHVKFADVWIHPKPGTDAALGLAMTHVVLKEFFVDRKVQYFEDYVKRYTDLPFLVILNKEGDSYVPGKFLRASDIGRNTPNAEWKLVVWDSISDSPAVPNGSIGFRWDDSGKWNLRLEDDGKEIDPTLTFLGKEDVVLMVQFPYFDENGTKILKRGVPAKLIKTDKGEIYVTTVFDLFLANIGVSRSLPGDYPKNYDDPLPYTPAWQEQITSVSRELVIQIAREFATNAELTRGRSMVIMGSGINHWFHTDLIYRAILSLVLLTGCQGVNGGGWAHYVGQEKVRPLEGWSTIAFALDWVRPARQMNGPSFFYFATDQWRYEEEKPEKFAPPLPGKYKDLHYADYNALAVRLGWLPFYPQFDKNPLELAKEIGDGSQEEVDKKIAELLASRKLNFAVHDPDNPINYPRILFVWRANLLSASGKAHEYFLKHLLGTKNSVMAHETVQKNPPKYINYTRKAGEGKLDLVVAIDFRMSGTALYSDIILPASTWYEKHDISSTDMHPFIHPFNPAVGPLWESKHDWDIFRDLAKTFSEMAKKYLPDPVKDIVAVPLMHDTQDEIAQPRGEIVDWYADGSVPIPGKTTCKFIIIERHYPSVYKKMISLGPLIVTQGMGVKGVIFVPKEEYEKLKEELGQIKEDVAAGCPDISEAKKVAEAILALSGVTNGSIALKGWEFLEKKTGLQLKDLVEEEAEVRYTFDDITVQPRRALPSPVWSGIEKGGRQYNAFAVNVEKLVPWRTLSGRQHFYLDHQLIIEFGEFLPVYKPPLSIEPFLENEAPKLEGKVLKVRWITPHNKWSIHTTFSDNLRMLHLFRGGPTVWINDKDAEEIGVKDNDWVEVISRNGVMVARAVVSPRIPRGTAFSYHAQDRTVNVPASELTKTRGGLHNSLTRIRLKPILMIGGYAQLSYSFNYWGPTGVQRDTIVLIRKMKEVNWLEG